MSERKRAKVTIVGAGNVGATLAHFVAANQLADVALIDVQGDMAKGKALDLYQATTVGGHDVVVEGGDDYALCAGSDVVAVTAGVPRKPGMSRDDLLKINAGIMSEVGTKVKQYAPDAIGVIISNPLDAMCHVFMDKTGFHPSKVMGMAGVLDSARYKMFIAEATGTSVKEIQAIVLGGHGDTMVPLSRLTSIGGVPLHRFLDQDTIAQIEDRTRKGGAEIVGLLKTGSAYYAPAYSSYAMIASILKDERRVLPASVYSQGSYGIEGLFVGLPAQIGAEGVTKIMEFELQDSEKAQLEVSRKAVAGLVDALKSMKMIG